MSLKDELLKQESAPAREQAVILERIKKDQRRVSRLKKLSMGFWIYFIVGWFGGILFMGYMENVRGHFHASPLMVYLWTAFYLGAMLSFVVALVCTVSLYVRWRSMTMGKIMATLTALQEDVRHLSQACADLQVGAARKSES